MKTTDYAGIDYGLGKTNINKDTGIRFGVIPANHVGQAWYDSSEPDYGEPTCPKCGNKAVERHTVSEQLENGVAVSVDDETREAYEPYRKHGFNEYACDDCKILLSSDDVWGDNPHGFTLDDGEYKAEQGGDDCDIFILKSPYFTYAQFCSPCAPGACYLLNNIETPSDNNKAYCFGHDWFEDGKAPYPVYSVESGLLVNS